MNMMTTPAVTMSTREIAELTGKSHGKVLRDARKMLLALELSEAGYVQKWTDPQNGQEYDELLLPRDLTETLLLGYSIPLRRKVVIRLRELEAELSTTRPLTTTETLIQMLQIQADVERRQADLELRQIEQQSHIGAMDVRLAVVEDTAPLKAKPQHTETKTEVKARMNRLYGLPAWLSDYVLTQISYRPPVFAMVKNSNENAQGSSFAVYQIVDISKLFKRFVSECQQVTATTATHPSIDRRFKLTRKAGGE